MIARWSASMEFLLFKMLDCAGISVKEKPVINWLGMPTSEGTTAMDCMMFISLRESRIECSNHPLVTSARMHSQSHDTFPGMHYPANRAPRL